MRRILTACVAATLFLAGCGGSDGASNLEKVKVSGGDSPKVTVPKDFKASKTTTRVITEGSGPKVAEGNVVKLNYVAINGRTNKTFDDSFKSKRAMTVVLDDKTVLPGFVTGLAGQKVGSRLLVAVPPKDGFNQANESLGLEADDTMVFLMDIEGLIPETANGTAKKAPATLPKLTLKDDRPARFAATAKTQKNPKKASATVLIKGKGDKIKPDSNLMIQYLGQIYPDGEIFDESWSKQVASFGLNQVIDCWKKQLPGHTVGSRIVLVCPADTAYGDNPPQGGAIKAGDTLIFQVDVLDAA